MHAAQTAPASAPTEIHGIAGDIVLQYLERVERLEEEKAQIMEGIREIFNEAKGNGFDVKAMRELLKLRKLQRHELEEQESILHTYRQAIGMN
jgi:uncharacterized protein (UPF0335 family)